MSNRVVLPWKAVPRGAESFHPDPWAVFRMQASGHDERIRDNGEYFEGIDFMTRLECRREVYVAVGELREFLGTGQASLALVVTLESGQTGSRFRRCVTRMTVPDEEAETVVTLNCSLDGSLLGSEIVLNTYLVLAEPRGEEHSLSATLAGSILWSDRWKRQIEGDEPLLAMVAKDDGHDDWLWHIDFPVEDWTLPLSSVLLVELNERREEFTRRIQETEPEAMQILGAAMASVVLRSFLVQEPDAEGTEASPDESCLAIAKHWLGLAFRGRAPSEVSDLMERDPSAFETAIQRTFVVAEPEGAA